MRFQVVGCTSVRFALLLLGLFTTTIAVATPEVIPGEYVVELADHSLGGTSRSLQARFDRHIATVKRTLGSRAALLSRPVQSHSSTDGTGAVIDTFCDELLAAGTVRSCSPNYVIRINASANDPQLGTLWGMGSGSGLDTSAAWDISTGSNSVVVAVIDTGISYAHPDLQANVWVNSAEIPANGIDDDGNGYVDDIHGIYAGRSGNPLDDNGHGTHVSGTIGAVGNNSLGVAGVNWTVKLMGLKFLDSRGSGSVADAIAAIDYMVLMRNRGVNVRVANASWGGSGYSEPLRSAIARAENAGIVFVAAAGNSSNDNDASPEYPASYSVANVVSVAAHDINLNLATFSNYGASNVDIAAPGVSIVSTWLNGAYASLSGTSMATPHVAGALALRFSLDPALSASQAISELYQSGISSPTFTGLLASGRRVSAARLLRGEFEELPPTDAAPDYCTYLTTQIPYTPDTTVNSTPFVQQSDEGFYHSVDLPFVFPFYGRSVRRLVLSPNGVIYAGGDAPLLDYENSSRAPINSIAALHTDLVPQGKQGIRVHLTPEKATINYRSSLYGMSSSGPVEVWINLYPDGSIEEYLTAANPNVIDTLNRRATIGVTGINGKFSTTYAYKSSAIRDRLAIRLSPICVSNALNPTALDVWTEVRKGQRVNRAVIGKPLHLDLLAEGEGVTLLTASFNRKQCDVAIPIEVSDGHASVTARLPAISARYNRVKFRVGTLSKSLAITGARSRRRSLRSSGQNSADAPLSARRFRNQCDRLLQSISRL